MHHHPPAPRRRIDLQTFALAIVSVPLLAWSAHLAWDGFGARELPLPAAVEIAQRRDLRPEHRRAAVAVVRRAALDAIDLLRDLATEEGPAGKEARAALEHCREAANR